MTMDNNYRGLKIGSLIDGKYKIIAKIGKGGMSTVWLALNTKANKQWAIKEIRQTSKNGRDLVEQNLMAEIGILKNLDHENLPRIIDIFEKNGTYLIIMDYIQGRTLKAILEDHGAQPQDDVVDWAIQLCSALEYLHTREPAIIYRDLKPGNVMLKPDGKIVLIDFGTAREYKTEQTEDTVSLGTKGYAAPEQYGGDRQTDARTDIYNLGATIYHLVTGKNPAKPPYEIRPIREWNPNLSTGLESIILKCVANDPEQRYQSARELRFALEHYKELETSYVEDKKKKIQLFLALLIASISFIVFGLGLNFYADSMRASSYDEQIHIASSLSSYDDQIKAYKKAIKIDPQRLDAYKNLLNNTFLRDGNFSQEEVDEMVEILGYVGRTKKDSFESQLKRNKEAYEEFAYDMGLAYFYYYGEDGNKQLSQPWFDIAKESSSLSSAQIERAKRFSQVADYNMKLNLKNKAGDSKISYSDYWDDIVLLASGDIAKEDNIKTALVVYRELVSQILIHANDFKNAGIKQDVILSELGVVELRMVDMMQMNDFDSVDDKEVVDGILNDIEACKRSLSIIYSK